MQCRFVKEFIVRSSRLSSAILATKSRPPLEYLREASLDEHAEGAEELAGMKNLPALGLRFEQWRANDDFAQVIDAIGPWRAMPGYRESLKRLVELVNR